MKKIEFPIVVDGNRFRIDVDLGIYSKEAVSAAAYKFTDRFFIYQQTNPQMNNSVFIIMESKGSVTIQDEDVKQFCNELIDQQVRVDVNNQFGKIREMLVEKAFKPISK